MKKIKALSKISAALLAVVMASENPLTQLSMVVYADEIDAIEEKVDEVSEEEVCAIEDEYADTGYANNEAEETALSSEEYILESVDETEQETTVSENASDFVSSNKVIREIASLREENIKAYEMADHSVQVCYYSEPVNYKNEDGEWMSIDNRLHFSRSGAENLFSGFSNASAGYDVRFASKADSCALFSIGANGVKADFKYVPSQYGKEDTENVESSEEKVVGAYESDELLEEISAAQSYDSLSENLQKTEENSTDKNDNNNDSWSCDIKLVDANDKKESSAVYSQDKEEDLVTGAVADTDVVGNDAETENTTINSNGDLINNTEIDSIPELPQPQTVWYESIEDGVSLKYNLLGDGVKESIFVESADAPNSFSFDISLSGQRAELTKDGDVLFFADDREKSFVIPAPVVVDASGAIDEGAHYELKKVNNKDYRLTLNISSKWFYSPERAFPIDADPTIEKYRKYDSMDALGDFVSVGSDGSRRKQHLYTGIDKKRNDDNALPQDEMNAGGVRAAAVTTKAAVSGLDGEEGEDSIETDEITPDNEKGIHYRTYMKLNLPQIPAGSIVTQADLRLKSTNKSGSQQYYYAVYSGEKSDNAKTDYDKITWKTQPLGSSATINQSDLEIIDYGNKGTDTLDITAAVKNWTQGSRINNGLCLIMSNETDAAIGKKKSKKKAEAEIKTGMRQIEPAKSGSKPFLTIAYKDFTGTEDYYSTHAQTAGNAGTSAINDYTGRLTFVHQDAASAGDRMPLSISHVYDVAFGDRRGDDKWETAPSGAYGKHFRLSTDVRLLVPAGETKVDDFPYVYIDSDGTKHYFEHKKVVYYANGKAVKPERNDKEYPTAADEDGLGLFVVPVSDKTLKEEYPLKIVDKSSSVSMYFDKAGYLGMITDSNQREDGANADKKERNAITFEHKKMSAVSGYTPGMAKADVASIKAKITGIDTKNEVETVETAVAVIADLEKLEVNATVFSVNYKAANALDIVRESMEGIVSGADKDKRKNLVKKALDEFENIEEADFEIYPEVTISVTDASGEKSVLSYNENNQLIAMSDPSESGKSISYSYDDKGMLTGIEHPSGIKAVFKYWNEDCLSGVMDECGQALIYSYDNNKRVVKISELTYISPKTKEKKLPRAIKKAELSLVKDIAKSHKNVKKKSKGKAAGQSISVNYDEYNETAYLFSGKDDEIGTKDDIENVYCFDNKGRCVNSYSRNALTKRVTGGAVCTYTDEKDEAEVANKIKDSAILGAQVVNYVSDSGFEKHKNNDKNNTNKWTVVNGNKYTEAVSNQKYLGKKSAHIKLDGETAKDVAPSFEQTIKVPFTGVYTVSAYVKTKDMVNSHVGFTAATSKVSASGEVEGNTDGESTGDDDSSEDGAVDDPDETEEEDDEAADEDSGAADSETMEIDETTVSEIENGWKRVETTIKVKKGQVITLSLSLYGQEGEAWFDCIQVEKSEIANQYNLLPNGGFEGNYASGRRSDVIPDGWTYSNSQGEVDAKLVSNKELGSDNKVIEGEKALCITGNESQKKVLAINPNFGDGNASYTFSCYVKADCAPVRGKRKVGIYIQGDMPEFDEDLDKEAVEYLKKHIDADDILPAAYAEINTAVNGWQYVSMALPGRNWKGKLIEIHFDNECGTLCVDACMLTRNSVDVRTYTSSGKLLTSKGKEKVTKYATDSRDRTKKMVMPGGARKLYSYDKNTNDLIKEKNIFSQPGKKVSTTQYTYDSFGNVINTELSWSNGKSLVTENVYDEKGRFVISSKDSRGYNHSYSYNQNNGTLETATDAEGKTTAYEYNAFLDPTKVTLSEAGVEGKTAGEVSFAYSSSMHALLEEISLSDELKYKFSYDAFGNVAGINKGKEKLVSYKYNKNNGKLSSVRYGNGNTAKLAYNSQELIESRDYGNNDKLKYQYDSKGRLSRIHDENTGLRYDITYDEAERVTNAAIINETDGKPVADFASSYDQAGRQSKFTYVYDKKAYTTEYGYATDDKPTSAKLPSGGYLRRVYDSIGRTRTESFTPQKKRATGADKDQDAGSEIKSTLFYLGTDRAGNEGIDSGKDYDYTTKLLAGLTTTIGKDTVAVNDTLKYDKVGRVSAYNDTTYEYDALGRLIKATDSSKGNTWTYTYDSIGNIVGSKSFVNGKENTQEYSYNAEAPDELKAYEINGERAECAKYKGGNPDNYLGYTLSWQRGGELKSLVKDGQKNNQDKKAEKLRAEYTYSYEGVRLKKDVNGTVTDYIINGNTILAQKTGAGEDKEQLNFYYSPEGKLLEIGYSKGINPENHYSVIKNAMGDVAALYTADGTYVGGYEYDPYGAVIAVNHNPDYADADGILEKNPFRYRGYYLDEETGWYYLNSRYYDPEVKRFINADDVKCLGVGDEFNSYNLFMYCAGNSVNNKDDSGHCYFNNMGVLCHDAWEYSDGYLSHFKFVNITETLDDTMAKNATDLNSYLLENGRISAINYFVDKVKPQGEWDFKSQDDWNLSPDNIYIYHSTLIKYDDIGNIHYGYVGRVLFSEEELLCAAGIVQIYTNTSSISYWKSNFDDPRDQESIKIGLDMWKMRERQ